MLCPPGRHVTGEVFKAVADWQLELGEMCPHSSLATIKCEASCPAEKAPSGVCDFIAPKDIVMMTKQKNKPKLLAAESILTFFRNCSFDFPDKDRIAFLGNVDCSMMRVLYGKSQKVHFETMKAAAGYHFAAMKNLRQVTLKLPITGIGIPEVNPYGDPSVDAPSSVASEVVPNVVEFDELGAPRMHETLSLAVQGFVAGSRVTPRDGSGKCIVQDNE